VVKQEPVEDGYSSTHDSGNQSNATEIIVKTEVTADDHLYGNDSQYHLSDDEAGAGGGDGSGPGLTSERGAGTELETPEVYVERSDGKEENYHSFIENKRRNVIPGDEGKKQATGKVKARTWRVPDAGKQCSEAGVGTEDLEASEEDEMDDQREQMLNLGLQRKEETVTTSRSSTGMRLRARKRKSYADVEGPGTDDECDESLYSSRSYMFVNEGQVSLLQDAEAALWPHQNFSGLSVPEVKTESLEIEGEGSSWFGNQELKSELKKMKLMPVKEKVETVKQKMYFPPAAIVPKGCKSRYAKPIVANQKVVTRTMTDETNHLLHVEKMIYPERSVMVKNKVQVKRKPTDSKNTFPVSTPDRTSLEGDVKENTDSVSDDEYDPSIVRSGRRTQKARTVYVCHPTKPVVRPSINGYYRKRHLEIGNPDKIEFLYCGNKVPQ